MTRRRHPKARVAKAFVRIPEPLPDGKVRCAGCSAVVSVTRNGRIRAHQSPAGEPCAYSVSYAMPIHLDEVPPVVVPPQPKRGGPTSEPKGINPDSRLEAGSHCKDCGKWLPGERSVCGKCSLRRNAERSRRR